MRLRDRRHRHVFDPPRAFRVFVDPERRRNSRWRGKLAALRRLPPEPITLDFSAGYFSISCSAPARLGSFSVE